MESRGSGGFSFSLSRQGALSSTEGVGSWVLTSHQLHGVTSGQAGTILNQTLDKRSSNHQQKSGSQFHTQHRDNLSHNLAERTAENSNLNSKTLFYKDCSLGSVSHRTEGRSCKTLHIALSSRDHRHRTERRSCKTLHTALTSRDHMYSTEGRSYETLHITLTATYYTSRCTSQLFCTWAIYVCCCACASMRMRACAHTHTHQRWIFT